MHLEPKWIFELFIKSTVLYYYYFFSGMMRPFLYKDRSLLRVLPIHSRIRPLFSPGSTESCLQHPLLGPKCSLDGDNTGNSNFLGRNSGLSLWIHVLELLFFPLYFPKSQNNPSVAHYISSLEPFPHLLKTHHRPSLFLPPSPTFS